MCNTWPKLFENEGEFARKESVVNLDELLCVCASLFAFFSLARALTSVHILNGDAHMRIHLPGVQHHPFHCDTPTAYNEQCILLM